MPCASLLSGQLLEGPFSVHPYVYPASKSPIADRSDDSHHLIRCEDSPILEAIRFSRKAKGFGRQCRGGSDILDESPRFGLDLDLDSSVACTESDPAGRDHHERKKAKATPTSAHIPAANQSQDSVSQLEFPVDWYKRAEIIAPRNTIVVGRTSVIASFSRSMCSTFGPR